MEVYDVVLLGSFTLALVQVLKSALAFDTRWSPLIAIAIGVPLTFAWGLIRDVDYGDAGNVAEALITGIFMVGLGAVGAWSAVKNTGAAIEANRSDTPDHIM